MLLMERKASLKESRVESTHVSMLHVQVQVLLEVKDPRSWLLGLPSLTAATAFRFLLGHVLQWRSVGLKRLDR